MVESNVDLTVGKKQPDDLCILGVDIEDRRCGAMMLDRRTRERSASNASRS